MSTYGVYGIVHDGSVLSASHPWDMYPSFWGWRLATEAFENRHQASVLGEASTQVRRCEWSLDAVEMTYEQCEELLLSSTEPETVLNPSERYHVFFHRPGGHKPPITASKLWTPPDLEPSFLEMARMDEMYHETLGDRSGYFYTWVTSPANLFVASTWSLYLEERVDSETVVWNLENEEHIGDLSALLVSGDSFEDAFYRRVIN